VELKKVSSIKSCPKCGGSGEKVGDAFVEFIRDSGGPVQEKQFKVYKCKKCDHPFSDEIFITEPGKIRNMRVTPDWSKR